MADVRLKVTPDELKRHAAQLERQIASAQRNWNGLCDTVRTSRCYWEGEAGDRGRKLLDDIKEDVQTVFSRLREHPSDLLKMAGIYVDTETKASNLANTLSDHVIE